MAKRKTTEEFIDDAIAVHGDRYDYSLVEYINNKTKVKIICAEHGIFLQRPDDHLHGKGCNVCKYYIWSIQLLKSQEQFIQDAIAVHGNRYDYSQVEYIATRLKVKIICPKHGTFKQRPRDHLSNQGCPKCSCRVSKPETQWLDYIGLPDNKDCRQVSLIINDKKYTVDGYDSTINTIYEFHGDFWHGNPNTTDHSKINPITNTTFQELYKNTIKKEKLIKESGYKLLTMWESDWKKFINHGC